MRCWQDEVMKRWGARIDRSTIWCVTKFWCNRNTRDMTRIKFKDHGSCLRSHDDEMWNMVCSKFTKFRMCAISIMIEPIETSTQGSSNDDVVTQEPCNGYNAMRIMTWRVSEVCVLGVPPTIIRCCEELTWVCKLGTQLWRRNPMCTKLWVWLCKRFNVLNL